MTLPPLLRLLRPHQYTKNLLVFAAPGAAGRLDEAGVLGRTALAFALFCMVSSAGYVFNDLADADADRRHPTKRHRPIASGAVAPRTARVTALGLCAAAVVPALLLGPGFALVLALYAALTAVYSSAAKRVPWFELGLLSVGFVLRAIAGGTATDTPLSGWFLAVVTFGALLLITGKRLGELLTLGATSSSRPVLAAYSSRSLRLASTIAAIGAVGAYAAWAAAEANNQAADETRSLFLRLTILPFIAAMIRFVRLSWQGRGETPDVLVLHDPVVVGAGLVWIALYALGIYA